MSSELSQLLSSPARTDVLETMFHQSAELGLRQVALVAGVNVRSAELALQGMLAEGLVSRRRVGARAFFALNRRNPCYPLLAAVFTAAEAIRIRDGLVAYKDAGRESLAFSVAALGMVARGRRSIGAT